MFCVNSAIRIRIRVRQNSLKPLFGTSLVLNHVSSATANLY